MEKLLVNLMDNNLILVNIFIILKFFVHKNGLNLLSLMSSSLQNVDPGFPGS